MAPPASGARGGRPLWVFSQELEEVSREEGGIHYGSGGCNVQMARCSPPGPAPPANNPGIHRRPSASQDPAVTQGWPSRKGRKRVEVVEPEMFHRRDIAPTPDVSQLKVRSI